MKGNCINSKKDLQRDAKMLIRKQFLGTIEQKCLLLLPLVHLFVLRPPACSELGVRTDTTHSRPDLQEHQRLRRAALLPGGSRQPGPQSARGLKEQTRLGFHLCSITSKWS